ncbi:hypothetical protein BYT27DRAFT_7127977 [Phlegmacium glaucopus]|nr:hypothetical protein BYT27DRAFT_7127977 [Phlegmacium glaucopus]
MSQLTQHIIEEAFTWIAKHLKISGHIDSSQFPCRLIVVGGAVSVLRGVRPTTEDIDFYCKEEKIMESIEQAGEAVALDMGLEENFMNSTVRLFLNHSVYAPAVARSFAQNELLFQNDALEVYVGDYGYQLISKVDRMSNAVASGRETMRKDQLDAAFHLHELIRIMKRNPKREEVVELYPSDGYTPKVLETVLDLVAKVYEERYNMTPFAL